MSIFEEISQIKQQLLHPQSPFAVTVDERTELPVYQNAASTMISMIQTARTESDETFLVYRDMSWTFGEFYQAVDNLASYLQSQHVQPGDKIALAMRNRPEWCIAFVAIVMVGAVPAPVNSFCQGDELIVAFEDVSASAVICDYERCQRVAQFQDRLPSLVISIDGGTDTVCAVDFYEALAFPSSAYHTPAVTSYEDALILFTSGATSRAKPVVSSHQAVCQSIFNINYIAALSGMCSADIVQAMQATQLPPVTLTAVPLFHVSGLHAQFLSNLVNQRKMVFIHKWDLDDVLQTMVDERVTVFNGAPSMVKQLIEHPDFVARGLDKQVYGLGFGGAGIPEKVMQNVLSMMSNKMVGSGFGMTETNGAVSAGSGRIFNTFPKASGVVCPIMQVRTVDDDNRPLATGEVGELQVKSITVMRTYLGQDTSDTFSEDGWLSTGDIGFVDAHQMIHIVDRKKDVINRAGENISAAEVESCISLFPGVTEVAVVGCPDEALGECVVAVLYTPLGDALDTEAVLAYCREHLASFKVPCKILVSASPLPRNPAGKLLKNLIKEYYLHPGQAVGASV